VLSALDVDQDNEISAEEIANAAAALRTLDRNHDGKLDANECGFRIWGDRAKDPVFVARAGKAFMRDHPVLAVLDSDHDGVISASEIKNAPVTLRRLDANGDGKLVEAELRPEPAELQVSQALLIYDLDGDGRISRKEFVSRPDRMDFFAKVDRNSDGFLTRDELLQFFRAAQTHAQPRVK
jgi:Ca2+-binding EF-hand superfamily protein